MPTGIEEAAAAIQSLVNWVDGFNYHMLVVNVLDVIMSTTYRFHYWRAHSRWLWMCRLVRQGGLNPGCGCEWTHLKVYKNELDTNRIGYEFYNFRHLIPNLFVLFVFILIFENCKNVTYVYACRSYR
jgi:hypothetical protein